MNGALETVEPAPPPRVETVTSRTSPREAAPSVAQPDHGRLLQRVEFAANRAIALLGYRLRRVGATGLLGAAALALALVVFLVQTLPQLRAVTTLRTQLDTLAPLAGAKPAAIASPPLASLPRREDAPRIVQEILAQADASGVDLPRGQYDFVPARDGVAARYSMTFPVHASYPKLRAFMDHTLTALPAVAVEGLRIERKSVGDDSVDAELKLVAFVRSGAP